MTARQPTPGLVGWIWVALDQLPFSPASRLPKSKYAERVSAKHPVTLDHRFIHPRPEQKED